jgi:hypothetical protein
LGGNGTGSLISIQRARHRARFEDEGVIVMKAILFAGVAALGLFTGAGFAATNSDGYGLLPAAQQTDRQTAALWTQNGWRQPATAAVRPPSAVMGATQVARVNHRIISKFYR